MQLEKKFNFEINVYFCMIGTEVEIQLITLFYSGCFRKID